MDAFRNLKRLTVVAVQVHTARSQLVARQLLPCHEDIDFDFLDSSHPGTNSGVDIDTLAWHHIGSDCLVNIEELVRINTRRYGLVEVDDIRRQPAMPTIPTIDYQIMIAEGLVEGFDEAVDNHIALLEGHACKSRFA